MVLTIRSWQTFLIWLGVLTFGFVWTTLKPGAPFSAFAEALTAGFGLYLTKRTIQKMDKFGGKNGLENGSK